MATLTADNDNSATTKPISSERAPSSLSASLTARLWLAAKHYFDTGFTFFGGPPVHFQLLYKRFVQDRHWVDEKTYQELFAVSQALPGPASTKLAFGICLHHLGFLPALLALTFWCLPGALGMYGLSLGVSRVGTVLPDPVYNLLSGLNAATVGLIALAGVQLSRRTITDGLSRTLLIFSACAGMCYTALWYYPVLMAAGAVIAVVWDLYLRKAMARATGVAARFITMIKNGRISRKGREEPEATIEPNQEDDVELDLTQSRGNRSATPASSVSSQKVETKFPIKFNVGISVVVAFFASFITLMVLRSVLRRPPMELKLFSNLYLAGTIIFGGGPVVIPLLRDYVVDEGWVSPRDFLIGLAVIQAFPGPNFNFAVYLASLASKHGTVPSYAAALLGLVAIFLPGIALMAGVSSFWQRVRKYQVISSLLRGINASAVGLIWTAVYRLWEAGYLVGNGESRGQSLGKDPWWLVVAAVSFCSNEWYGVPAAVSIVIGGVLGVIRWAVVRHV
ncbi:hypothetical protein CPB86DRAFT_787407 [Serendipita vermifera]|nr:hypothetical protein CPB86DRAFT_787407 [Serendipita vermifera]